MAGQGFAPKATRSRRRDTERRAAEMTAVAADGELRGPDLPDDVVPDGESWHPRTRAWWSTWRRSAQSQTFTDTDWDFLLDTALMHHVMWTKGRWEFASELRLRAAKFGATPEDRMRLRITVEVPSDAPPDAAEPRGSVTDIASRRSRLSG
ncbi:hypothetical protein [Allonocardiopsis opalescens]|uniref:Terminase small subunit n=1 Tax=Allonocardiopsis opalescens TaxID=1144618 RepID=A0A2T0PVM5_9ACTN|nr:hypothetical protein [Allonocardiopsis opalescens]PRX95583.1 hypothetical protein CLV72_109192 [Allonocardiopsis opalescens]